MMGDVARFSICTPSILIIFSEVFVLFCAGGKQAPEENPSNSRLKSIPTTDHDNGLYDMKSHKCLYQFNSRTLALKHM